MKAETVCSFLERKEDMMPRLKMFWVVLLTFALTGFMDASSFVMAGGDPNSPSGVDSPHYTHLYHPRGPKALISPWGGNFYNQCLRCHTSLPPAYNNVNTYACNDCHSPGGIYDGVNNTGDDPNDPTDDLGVLANDGGFPPVYSNWYNMGDPNDAGWQVDGDPNTPGWQTDPNDPSGSQIYYTKDPNDQDDDSLKSSKKDWCLTCHDRLIDYYDDSATYNAGHYVDYEVGRYYDRVFKCTHNGTSGIPPDHPVNGFEGSGTHYWETAASRFETGTSLVSDFEGATPAEAFSGWGALGDIAGGQWLPYQNWDDQYFAVHGIGGNYAWLLLDWDQDLLHSGGLVSKTLSSPVDFSTRGSFNFYLKVHDSRGIVGVFVYLVDDDGDNSVSKFLINGAPSLNIPPGTYINVDGVKDKQWKLVSLPLASFDGPPAFDLSNVNKIKLLFWEIAGGGHYKMAFGIDEIGCDVTGPNVVGDNVTWGVNVTGHRSIHCSDFCHNANSEHIDGNRLTTLEYIREWPCYDHNMQDYNLNPTNFRLYGGPSSQMELPIFRPNYFIDYFTNAVGYYYDGDYVWYKGSIFKCTNDGTDPDLVPPDDDINGYQGSGTDYWDLDSAPYALCLSACHDRDWLFAEITPEPNDPHTNFSNEYGENLHSIHVPSPYGHEYPRTCVTCHDPMGQHGPAMTRKELGGFIYFDATGSEVEFGADCDDDDTMDWYDPDCQEGGAETEGTFNDTNNDGVGNLVDGPLCGNTCHNWGIPPNDDPNDPSGHPYGGLASISNSQYKKGYYVREWEFIPVGEGHDNESHHTHGAADCRGPGFGSLAYSDPVKYCTPCHGAEWWPDTPDEVTDLSSTECDDCHPDPVLPEYWIKGQDAIIAGKCNYCHSDQGDYDGVNDPVLGVIANWEDGVYDYDSDPHALKPGLEKWCLTCHDDVPAYSKHDPNDPTGVDAPKIDHLAGVELYYEAGHGHYECPSGTTIECLACHTVECSDDPNSPYCNYVHIDHDDRTYWFNDEDVETPIDGFADMYSHSGVKYAEGYRLRYVDVGGSLEVPLMIPAQYSKTFGNDDELVRDRGFRRCFKCHDSHKVLFNDESNFYNSGDTNFKPGNPDPPKRYSYQFSGTLEINLHYQHVIARQARWWDSDWDDSTEQDFFIGLGFDSMITCSSCHNVHGVPGTVVDDGSPSGYTCPNWPQMRDGSLVGRSGFGFSYVKKQYTTDWPTAGGDAIVTSISATHLNSIGAIFREDLKNTPMMCGGGTTGCHADMVPTDQAAYDADAAARYLEYYRAPWMDYAPLVCPLP